MKIPKLSILIATCPPREKQLKHLISLLQPQLTPEVEVLVCWDNFTRYVGISRQKLLEAATGQYVCFIDDDDEVPHYYIDKILASLDGVDYVGWRQQLYHDGQKMKPTFHSLRYRVSEDEHGWYRNISHLNPIRRKLALKGRFDQAIPEDNDWALQVTPYVKTEHYIEDCMYYYFHSTDSSLWDKPLKPVLGAVRPNLPKQFKYLGL